MSSSSSEEEKPLSEERKSRKRTKRQKKERKRQKEIDRLIEDPDTLWVVEKLISKEVRDGVEGYLVRWEGFDEEWDTWEPRSSLEQNSSALIARFENLDHPALDADGKHCICKKPYNPEDGAMIQCCYCLGWFHYKCLDIDVIKANQLMRFFCDACGERNPCAKSKLKIKFTSFYSESSTDTLWSASPC